MRTTLSLDDDVFAVVRLRAQRERTSLGEAVSRYVRDALRANTQAPATPVAFRSKYSVLAANMFGGDDFIPRSKYRIFAAKGNRCYRRLGIGTQGIAHVA